MTWTTGGPAPPRGPGAPRASRAPRTPASGAVTWLGARLRAFRARARLVDGLVASAARRWAPGGRPWRPAPPA